MPGFAAALGAAGRTAARREVVGLYVNGREDTQGLAILLLPDGGRRLPLRDLAPLLGLPSPAIERDALLLQTPLGEARFRFGELDRRADEYFADLSTVAERLAAEVVFDEAEYAIQIRLAWDPRPQAGTLAEQPILPDTLAPAAGLSRVRGERLWQDTEAGTLGSGFLEAYGVLAGGSWQGRYRREASGLERLQDYHWQRRAGNWGVLFGHQVIGTHPLLPGFDLTGTQLAWSNAPETLLAPLDPGRLTADRTGPIRSFIGQGPAGGLAELLIDGSARGRVRIPLDGRFEFRDVAVPPGYSRIEVALYPPFAIGAPSEVLDFSGRASDRLLAHGATVMHAGLGQNGNFLDDLVGNRGAAGFVGVRHGVRPGLSVELATQHRDGEVESALAATASLRALGVATAGVAFANDASASLMTLDGDRGRSFWRASLRDVEGGLQVGIERDLRDHFAEVGWRQWPRWEASLIGRDRQEVGQRIQYLKPALRWRALDRLVVQSRPDELGQYVHDLSWTLGRDTRLIARQDSTLRQVGVDHRWSSQWLSSVAVLEVRDSGRRRASVLSSWQSANPFGWYVDAGVLASERSSGFLLRAGRELRPGLRFRVEARRDPLEDGIGPARETLATAALSFDLGRAGGGYTRAGSARGGTGGLGGRIVGAGDGIPLDGIAIRVDGQVRARTDAAGRFHMLDLPPGVYRLELDEEALPLELSSQRLAYYAQVARGATTAVEFPVALRLGAGGRVVTAQGLPLSEGEVVVLDADDRVRARAPINRFGYFRVDGLPPGHYRLQCIDAAERPCGERMLLLTDRFVFAQDIEAKRPEPPALGSGSTREGDHDESN